MEAEARERDQEFYLRLTRLVDDMRRMGCDCDLDVSQSNSPDYLTAAIRFRTPDAPTQTTWGFRRSAGPAADR